MIKVRELEIWGYPGSIRGREACDLLIGEIAIELGLPGTVVIPYHSIPSSVDVENLSICLTERELALEEFSSFCVLRGLKVDTQDTNAANDFLNFYFGQKLGWLHLPTAYDDESRILFISKVLKGQSCALIDPDSLSCTIN